MSSRKSDGLDQLAPEVQAALAQERTIDITTIGRRSGQPRRLEMWFHNVGGRIYITGTPGRRDWYANLVAHPDFTFHLKESVTADLPARARPITEPGERRRVFGAVLEKLDRDGQLDAWMQGAPLVEVTFLPQR